MACTRIVIEKRQSRTEAGLCGTFGKNASECNRPEGKQRRATASPPDLARNRSMLDRWPSEFILDLYQLR
jgi:hypothetical protein